MVENYEAVKKCLVFLCCLIVFEVYNVSIHADPFNIECISIENCPDALKLLSTKNLTPELIDILTHCGSSKKFGPLVCCPKLTSCRTPDGQNGTCMVLVQCRGLLRKSAQSVDLSRYRCNGYFERYVCCSDQEISDKLNDSHNFRDLTRGPSHTEEIQSDQPRYPFNPKIDRDKYLDRHSPSKNRIEQDYPGKSGDRRWNTENAPQDRFDPHTNNHIYSQGSGTDENTYDTNSRLWSEPQSSSSKINGRDSWRPGSSRNRSSTNHKISTSKIIDKATWEPNVARSLPNTTTIPTTRVWYYATSRFANDGSSTDSIDDDNFVFPDNNVAAAIKDISTIRDEQSSTSTTTRHRSSLSYETTTPDASETWSDEDTVARVSPKRTSTTNTSTTRVWYDTTTRFAREDGRSTSRTVGDNFVFPDTYAAVAFNNISVVLGEQSSSSTTNDQIQATTLDIDDIGSESIDKDAQEENLARVLLKTTTTPTTKIWFDTTSKFPSSTSRTIVNDSARPDIYETVSFKNISTICGRQTASNDKIVGGSAVDPGEYPWMALLEYTNNRGKIFGCGGTLINKRYVLTAAHCVDRRVLQARRMQLHRVLLGEYDTRNVTDCIYLPYGTKCADSPIYFGIDSALPHERFDNVNGAEDIALIRLDSDVTFSDYIKPICLPTADLAIRANESLIVVGWGKTSTDHSSPVPMKARLPRVENSACDRRGTTALSGGQMCAGVGDGVDTCTGDSGGPMMLERVRNFEIVAYQMGIVSYGLAGSGGCGNAPSVNTYVPHYVEWILSRVRD